MMPLTMTPQRYEEIRRLMQERQLAREAAEVVAGTDWCRQPAFTDVDIFLDYLDRQAASHDRPARSRHRKR